MRSCPLGIFGKGLLQLRSTRSCRRLASSEGPGRLKTLVARERVMETARTIRMQRCGVDLADAPPVRGRKREAQPLSAESQAGVLRLALTEVVARDGPLHYQADEVATATVMQGGLGLDRGGQEVPIAGEVGTPPPARCAN